MIDILFIILSLLPGTPIPDSILGEIDENGMIRQENPGLIPVTVAAHVDNFITEMCSYELFLSDWWPVNLSQNVSRNVTSG